MGGSEYKVWNHKDKWLNFSVGRHWNHSWKPGPRRVESSRRDPEDLRRRRHPGVRARYLTCVISIAPPAGRAPQPTPHKRDLKTHFPGRGHSPGRLWGHHRPRWKKAPLRIVTATHPGFPTLSACQNQTFYTLNFQSYIYSWILHFVAMLI